MRWFIKSEKAQAAVELAVVASIIILAFSALITLTEQVNRTQSHIQKTFKARLAEAKTQGYSTAQEGDYYRAPNIIDPYAPGEPVFLRTSGKVLWKGSGKFSETDAEWNENGYSEKIKYNKKLIRKSKSDPGGELDARHEVTYYDPIAKKEVTRGEYK
ncbi:MAG: hypothetical protein AAB089_04430 [Nitrospirota bacterium]